MFMKDSILCVLTFMAILLNTDALSVPVSTIPSTKPQSGQNDVETIRSLQPPLNDQQVPAFKYIYLDKDGSVSMSKDQAQPTKKIEIAGSPGTSLRAMYTAAAYLANITKHISPTVFYNIASKSSVGIFSAKEKLTIFSEYTYFGNGDCGSSCDKECAKTCTTDGRKIEELTGVGGKRAVILDDNILCTQNDPYQGRENILAHEFTHTIHKHALTDVQKLKIANAYRLAKRRRTWRIDSYAMVSSFEYFAEGATVFLGVNQYNRLNTGGMNLCGSQFCETEELGRRNLMRNDGLLFDVLSEVFTWNRPFLMSSLAVSPPG